MKLLSEKDLIWSPVVANSNMNRERNCSGINSYEQEFGFKPEGFLATHIKSTGQGNWLDLCCGQGKALVQAAIFLAENNLQHNVRLKGVDLVDSFSLIPASVHCLSFEAASVVDRIPDDRYDLITCVHGLHYIGDKLKVLQNAFKALNPQGFFIANLDLNNIQISGCDTRKYLKKIFRQYDILYNGRTKILTCRGMRGIEFSLQYCGANDQAGPNYTGQGSVNSVYELL